MIGVKLEITNLIKPLIQALKDGSDEWKHLFDVGVTEYLNNQTEKYYTTYSFLHRHEKLKFSEIYYPITATYNKRKTNFSFISKELRQYQYISIIGRAGSGKSMLTKFLFLTCIQHRFKVPVIIELRHLNHQNEKLKHLISNKILSNNVKPSESTLNKALRNGSFLFILDGFDEIYSDRKQSIIQQIDQFIDNYHKNCFVITSRPDAGIENFSRFYQFNVDPLPKRDIINFISKLVSNQERKHRMFEIVRNADSENYIEYLSNPLLLSMFILTFGNHPEIPKKRSSFYNNVFETLYSKHDGWTKNSFNRERLTGLQKTEFEEILSLLSYITFFNGDYSFTEEKLTNVLKDVNQYIEKFKGYKFNATDLISDLRISLSILVKDGFEYSFPHRSLQEFFTAKYISKLTPEQRKKIYKKFFDEVIPKRVDNSSIFWNLCDELGKNDFYQDFLINQLKMFKS